MWKDLEIERPGGWRQVDVNKDKCCYSYLLCNLSSYLSVVTAVVNADNNQTMPTNVDKIIRKLKKLVKEALRSGKIYHCNRIKVAIGYDFTNVRKLNDIEWSEFEDHECYFRKSIAGKQTNVGDFICKGDFQKWFGISKILSGLFFKNNVFLEKNLREEEWSIPLLKFCKRVIKKFPLQFVNEDITMLKYIKESINYVNKTIIPFKKKVI